LGKCEGKTLHSFVGGAGGLLIK